MTASTRLPQPAQPDDATLPSNAARGWSHAVRPPELGFPDLSDGRSRAGWLHRLIDAEQDRFFLWTPICFGLGIAAYFMLRHEPALVTAAVPAVIALTVASFLPRGGVARMIVAGFLLVGLGMLVAKVRVEMVRAPVISKPIFRAEVSGTIIKAEPRGDRGQRLTLAVDHLAGVEASARPARVRIRTLKKDGPRFAVGDRVAVQARLSPPSEPVIPGGFDFARTAWFERIGAVGYTFQTPRKLAPLGEPTAWARTQVAIQRLREAIGARVRAYLPDETGGMAIALMTGERGGISAETNEAYRSSGLFHILSISGLHMVVMAGTMFVLVRILLATVPSLALRLPVKKIAAVAGMFAAIGYLAISGGAFATVRAALMMLVAFTAVLFDRPALALRNVALAALVILFIYPESLFDAGFQMSFAAVTALVAAFEELRRRRARQEMTPTGRGRTVTFFAGIIATTLIASLAVAPFAAYHFHQSQQLALVANMMAIPICNLVVMPAALAAYVLMPFGFEGIALKILGLGINAMTWCAHFVAGLPGAVARLPAFSTLAFALIVIGGLWLLLWQTRLRLVGVALIAAGIAIAPMSVRPDLLIGRDGKLVALRADDGRLTALPAPRTNYELRRWLQHDGDARNVKEVADGSAFRCDALGCAARRGNVEIVIPKHPAAFADDCRANAGFRRIVVLSVPKPAACESGNVETVDLFDVWRDGTHAFYFTGAITSDFRAPGFAAGLGQPVSRVETVRDHRGDWPWSRPAPAARVTERRGNGAAAVGRDRDRRPGSTIRPAPPPEGAPAHHTRHQTPRGDNALASSPAFDIEDAIADAEADISDQVR